MRPRPIDSITIKAALLLGFGLTFALWLLVGYRFTRRIAEVQREAAKINARYIHAQELLSTVRAQVLLGSVYVRDALLDPDPASAGSYRRQLADTYRAVVDALEQYVPVVDSPAERERVNRLHKEIDDFRATTMEVLATDNTRWRTDARLLLRSRIVPKREVVIRVSEEVQALNRVEFVQQQTRIADVYRATQRSGWEQLGFALAASFGIALLATTHAGGLERRLREQVAKDEESARTLQRLSSQLIVAQEEERRTIARELHDEVGQVLTAIKVELAVAQRAIEADGGRAQLLQDARSLADGALHTVRDLSQLLHPPLLDDLGLSAAIEWYVRGFSKRYGVRVDVIHDPRAERLAAETEVAAYRIVQEALTNVARHARATVCHVHVQQLPDTAVIAIEDDGIGFDVAAVAQAPGRGLGLIGIRERVAQLHGKLRLESAPGNGTRLMVELPSHSRPAIEEGDVNASEPVAELTA